MAKPVKKPVNPADCCKIPNCRKMLCGAINAYYERMTGCSVIATEVGEEKAQFAPLQLWTVTELKKFIVGLQKQCGDETTAVFVDPIGPNYACHTPSACKPAPRGRYDNCGC